MPLRNTGTFIVRSFIVKLHRASHAELFSFLLFQMQVISYVCNITKWVKPCGNSTKVGAGVTALCPPQLGTILQRTQPSPNSKALLHSNGLWSLLFCVQPTAAPAACSKYLRTS